MKNERFADEKYKKLFTLLIEYINPQIKLSSGVITSEQLSIIPKYVIFREHDWGCIRKAISLLRVSPGLYQFKTEQLTIDDIFVLYNIGKDINRANYKKREERKKNKEILITEPVQQVIDLPESSSDKKVDVKEKKKNHELTDEDFDSMVPIELLRSMSKNLQHLAKQNGRIVGNLRELTEKFVPEVKERRLKREKAKKESK